MHWTVRLTFLSALAAALPSDLTLRAPTPLDLKLEVGGNSLVKATLTNAGKEHLRLFKPGSILDTIPVYKAQVFSDGKWFKTYTMPRIPVLTA